MNIKGTSRCVFALFLIALAISSKALAIESPQYNVIFDDGIVEYRQYSPYIVAETLVESSSSYRSLSNQGFMRLFRYITGSNSSKTDIEMTSPVQQTVVNEKIAMTAPVQRVETSEGLRVAFMLPSEFTIETAPLPTDERVNLRQIKPQLMAVIRYSGRWTERNFEKHKAQLLKAIESAAIETVGVVESASYDAPYVLPFLRRNEVMVEVKTAPVSSLAIATGL
jgi:hypothetical protein